MKVINLASYVKIVFLIISLRNKSLWRNNEVSIFINFMCLSLLCTWILPFNHMHIYPSSTRAF